MPSHWNWRKCEVQDESGAVIAGPVAMAALWRLKNYSNRAIKGYFVRDPEGRRMRATTIGWSGFEEAIKNDAEAWDMIRNWDDRHEV